MSDAPDDLGQRIQQLRLAHGLTQRALAEPKYTAAYVSSVESGKRSPSGEALRHFAQRLGVPDAELTAGQPGDSLGLELALTDALATGSGFMSVAAAAEKAGDSRRWAWALLFLDPEAHLADAARMLEGEPPSDRVPLVLAQARAAEPRYAIYLLEEFRDALHRGGLPDPDARYVLHAHLAERYLQIGDEERAAAAAQVALALAGPQDPAAVGADYLATAQALLALRRPADAAVALGQAKAAFLRAHTRPALAACHRARGWMRREAGQLEEAAADLAQARHLYGPTEAALDIGVELAEVQRRRGRPDQAETLLYEALQASTDTQTAPLRAAGAYRERGLLALDRGDDTEAESMLRQAIALYRDTGPRRELARSLRALGDLLTAQTRLAEAADLLRTGLLDLERME
ncbi:transcriptional regulator [Rhizocola hellebori]|uniref:Transcriptional regulator n=1 Tax=Rhizocola hellebori TaxID=1392758 RepID=A0A8J3QBY7_9ACTN|nr:tetratricopeptide repeat protein [Rhizocola hellebori]GIH08028.1 transcriptional regulator [Rhizocola hellebori]